MLNGKKILLGVTGGIAAYKAAYLIRLFIKAKAEVRVIMTPSAGEFISALTLSTLSKNPVFSEFINENKGEWNNHVELGLWADIFIIAPATANTIAKMANGISDNILLATYLSARCPVLVAPAMDLDMFKHASTVTNINLLREHGVGIIDVAYGELASGLTGSGRMTEPEDIFEKVNGLLTGNKPLSGKNVLVTAGPTYEQIDPVRFIGNHSSGKMGVAIARQLKNQGANVHLILGPVATEYELEGIEVNNVISAEEMFEAAIKNFPGSDIAVLAAAVADYKPKNVQSSKIKKKSNSISIDLVSTKDIAATLGNSKKEGQLIVGFALETDDEVKNATKKLHNKNFDMIVLNSLKNKGAGFGYDTNKVSFLTRDNKLTEFELKSKEDVAKDIVDAIVDILSKF